MRRAFAVLLLAVALLPISTAFVAMGGKPGGAIIVPDASYGGYTTAVVNPGGTNVYVFVQCYAPDFDGQYVYAAYFPVDANKQATLGPLWSTLWPGGNASCKATEGYFRRDGLGKWVGVASTNFQVAG
jgi:hypothetical protein